MESVYSEMGLTWASVEKDVPYTKVVWTVGKDGIPTYYFVNEDNQVK